jgi:hypothetical protein
MYSVHIVLWAVHSMSVDGKYLAVVTTSYHAVKQSAMSLGAVGGEDLPMLSNEREQALCCLLDSFVERLRWRVSIRTQDIILRLEHTL